MPTWYASQPPASLNEGGINAGVHQAPDWLSVHLWACESLCVDVYMCSSVCATGSLHQNCLDLAGATGQPVLPLAFSICWPLLLSSSPPPNNDARLTCGLVPHFCSALTPRLSSWPLWSSYFICVQQQHAENKPSTAEQSWACLVLGHQNTLGNYGPLTGSSGSWPIINTIVFGVMLNYKFCDILL